MSFRSGGNLVIYKNLYLSEDVFTLCVDQQVANLQKIAFLYKDMGPGYIRHRSQQPPSLITLYIELDGKPKWRPLNFGYHDVMRTVPILQLTNKGRV